MENITGTVVKLTEKYIVLIMPDGSFKNVNRSKEQVPLIGEQFTFRATVPIYRWAAIAAAFLIFAICIKLCIPLLDNSRTAYIIALDINPSIEIQTDNKLRILKIDSINDDAEKIIGKSEYLNTYLLTALENIIDKCIGYGYLNHERTGFINVTVIPLKGNDLNYENTIKESLQGVLKNRNVEVKLAIGISSIDILNKAHQNNLSANRYILYRDLTEKGVAITVDEARKIPLRELMEFEKIQKNRTEEYIPEIKDNSGNKGRKSGTNNYETDSSKSSEALNPNDNADFGSSGALKGGNIGEKSNGISDTTSDDNPNKENENTDTTISESNSIEGKKISPESSAGIGINPSQGQTSNSTESGESIEQSQEPADKNDDSIDATNSNIDNRGSNRDNTSGNSTDSSNKRCQ